MTYSPSGFSDLVLLCQSEILALMRRTSAAAERAAGLAGLLQRLQSAAERSCCLLEDGSLGLTARPGSVPLTAEQQESLRTRLASLDPRAAGVQALTDAWPDGLRGLAAVIQDDGYPRGYLVLGLAADADDQAVERAESVLAVAATLAALEWSRESLRIEHAELGRFALIGQAFLGLAHDLNNALNSMMLQTSVVQLRVNESVRPDLTVIRQQGAQAAGLLRTLQHVVQERREQSYPVALNTIVAEVLHERPQLCPVGSLHLSPDNPYVSGTHSSVKQLVRLVFQGVCASPAPIRVWTEKRGEGAVLAVALEAEGDLPPLDSVLWDPLDEVDRQAGRSLLRQLGGTAELTQAPDDAMVISLTWGETIP